MDWREECGYFKQKRNKWWTGQGVQGDLHYWECHYLRTCSSYSLLENIRTKRGTQKLKGNAKMMLTFMFIQNQQHLEAPCLWTSSLFTQQRRDPFGLCMDFWILQESCKKREVDRLKTCLLLGCVVGGFHHLNVISAKVAVDVRYISALHVGKKCRSYKECYCCCMCWRTRWERGESEREACLPPVIQTKQPSIVNISNTHLYFYRNTAARSVAKTRQGNSLKCWNLRENKLLKNSLAVLNWYKM